VVGGHTHAVQIKNTDHGRAVFSQCQSASCVDFVMAVAVLAAAAAATGGHKGCCAKGQQGMSMKFDKRYLNRSHGQKLKKQQVVKKTGQNGGRLDLRVKNSDGHAKANRPSSSAAMGVRYQNSALMV
jgi:hypothetical protein